MTFIIACGMLTLGQELVLVLVLGLVLLVMPVLLLAPMLVQALLVLVVVIQKLRSDLATACSVRKHHQSLLGRLDGIPLFLMKKHRTRLALTFLGNSKQGNLEVVRLLIRQ